MYNKLSSKTHTYSCILFDVFLFMPKYLFMVQYNKPLHSHLIDRYKRLTAPTSKSNKSNSMKNDAFLESLFIIQERRWRFGKYLYFCKICLLIMSLPPYKAHNYIGGRYDIWGEKIFLQFYHWFMKNNIGNFLWWLMRTR